VLKVSASNNDMALLDNKYDEHHSLKFKVIIFIVNKMYVIYSKVFSTVFFHIIHIQ